MRKQRARASMRKTSGTPAIKPALAAAEPFAPAAETRDAMDLVCHPSLSGRVVLWPFPPEHPAAGRLLSVIELAALLLKAAQSEAAGGAPFLQAAIRSEWISIVTLVQAQKQFQSILANPEFHKSGLISTVTTKPELLAFANTISKLGEILSTFAFHEAELRDHAVRELLAGRAIVIQGGDIVASYTVSAGEAGGVIYPMAAGDRRAGMLGVVVQTAAVVVAALAAPTSVGWQPMRTTLQHEIPLLCAILEAEQSFRVLVAHPQGQADAPSSPSIAPAIAAFCMVGARLACSMMEAASVEAVHRDHAVADLLAGRAWVAPDGSIIKAPEHTRAL